MGRTSVGAVLAGLAFLGWLLWREARRPPSPPAQQAMAPVRDREREGLALTPAHAPGADEGRRESEGRARIVESGRLLEGRVIGCAAGADPRSGVAAAEVEVRLARGSSDGVGWLALPSARSEEDGSFRFALPEEDTEPRRFRLRVEAEEGYGASTLEVELGAGERRRTGLLLVRRAPGNLAGRTVDAERRPLPGVEVVRLDWNATREILVTEDVTYSDSEGRFLFRGLSSAPGFEARKPGYRLVLCPRVEPEEDGTWPPVELVLDHTGQLRLWVTDRSGAPLPDVHLAVSLAPPERFASPGYDDALRTPRFQRTDEAGSARVDELWVARRLRVALDREVGSEWRSESRPLGSFEWLEGAHPVLEGTPGARPLVLEPGARREVRVELLRLVGQVVDGEGRPCPEPWVGVHALDRPSFAPDGGLLETRGDEAGRFALELLAVRPLGRVRLEARDGRTGARSASDLERLEETAPRDDPSRRASRLVDLERHGDEDSLTLVLGAPSKEEDPSAGATLTVEVAQMGGEAGTATVLVARLHPEGSAPDVPELGVESLWSEPTGWPAAVLGSGALPGRRPSEQGTLDVELKPVGPDPVPLVLEPGLYWIGAQAKAADGNLTFPIGTGLVRVGAGEHRLRFELTPTGSVAGRVRDLPRDAELFVALAREGVLLTLDARRPERRVLGELGADGSFRFPVVPVGELELRLGTRAELLEGRWRKREVFALERGESHELEWGE